MYARYNISPDVKTALAQEELYKKEGLSIRRTALNKQEKRQTKFLNSLNPQDGVIDMSKFEETCFPIPKNKDIFISHSHADDSEEEGDYVATLVGFLKYEFNISCFVDDWEWGYCDDLLGAIDKKYARHSSGEGFSYEVRNITTALAHVPVTIALLKAMDATECVFFLETRNSTSLDLHSSKNTRSPWLYAENAAMELLRPSLPPHRQGSMEEIDKCEHDSEDYHTTASRLPEFTFRLNSNSIPPLNWEFLTNWKKEKRNFEDAKKALNWLYQNQPDGIK